MNHDSRSSDVPLCVDLDGTLIKSDMLQESLCALIRQNPLLLLLVPFWLLRGRAFMKRQIALRVSIDSSDIPLQPKFLEYLEREHAAGRKLILATASEIKLALPIAERVGLFGEVLASEGTMNYSGTNKARLLSERFPKGFDYAGNSRTDYKVWRASRRCIAVSPDLGFLKGVSKAFPGALVFHESGGGAKTLLRAIRVHQWVKNLLLIVPLVMAHKFGVPELLWRVAGAFAAMCFCASSVYLLNDLIDLESDRQHHSKRRRPFASGDLPLSLGLILVPVLLLGAAVIACSLPESFRYALGIYFCITLAYSLLLKRIALVDILVLASLYTLRIIAGGYAVEVPVSQWLLAFSMFLFLSLASVKRFSELLELRKRNRESTAGRGYLADDLEQIGQFGSASGYISVLVLALYVSSEEVTQLYLHPQLIWLLCPIVLYWISRIWLLAHRGVLHEDPIVFAITDRVSYLVGLLAAVVLLLAI